MYNVKEHVCVLTYLFNLLTSEQQVCIYNKLTQETMKDAEF